MIEDEDDNDGHGEPANQEQAHAAAERQRASRREAFKRELERNRASEAEYQAKADEAGKERDEWHRRWSLRLARLSALTEWQAFCFSFMAMTSSQTPAAVAYFRTSSRTNVGEDKDSLRRQEEAVRTYAEAHGLGIVREFYDAAVKGSDAIHTRPGFAELLDYMAGNGARIILVESASRFARDLAVQLTGHDLLKGMGFTLVPVDAPDFFVDETPTATMVRQILGAVSEFEKASLVAKLKAARTRKRKEGEYMGGFKAHDESAAKAAQKLVGIDPATGKKRSLRAIAGKLADAGFLGPQGRPYGAGSVAAMLRKPLAA